MEKRKYFCTVKHRADILKPLLSAIIALTIGCQIQATAIGDGNRSDSVEVSLLTCSPHTEVYSLYGHTAIRYRNAATGEDWAFNYGVFNFRKPFFALRFAFGLTDYELGVIPYKYFEEEYRKTGRQVTEQVLNMTSDEKRRLYDALRINYLPENRVYRYNYFYDNCTTRARDMIEQSISGTVEYPYNKDDAMPTYREMIHAKTKNHHWAAFGNDLCLGVKADMNTDYRQQQFLPGNLMRAFEKAVIADGNGTRPLVKETNVLVKSAPQPVSSSFPLTPTQCACLLLVASIAIAFIEYRKKKIIKTWDALLLIVDGLAGIVILALFFSEHPTTSTNLQILLLNPLPLCFLYSVLKGKILFWNIFTALIILFFVCGIFQDYAEGMEILALSLLTRCGIHLYFSHNTKFQITPKNV